MSKKLESKQPATVREALADYRFDMLVHVMPFLEMAETLLGRFTNECEGDIGDEESREKIALGLGSAFKFCNQFMYRRINETDSCYMDELPAGTPR